METEQKYILAVGANPCWEKLLTFQNFVPGEVNRASAAGGYAAGKAGNFCRALKSLDGRYRGRQLTFLGGRTGEAFAEDQKREGLECLAVQVQHETRTCINCVCNGEMTELVEPGFAPDENETAQFLKLLEEQIPGAAALALCGTIPPGTPESLVDGIIALLQKQDIPVLLDNWQEAQKFLDADLKVLLKINAAELKRLVGIANVPDALEDLRRRYPGLIAGITAGPEKAWLIAPECDGAVQLSPRKLDLIVNPLGAGDVASAVFIERFLEGCQPEEAFSEALDAATKSCMNEIAGLF